MSQASSEPVKKAPILVRFLDKFGNIFALNVIWILFSLPIITIGASTTALYTMTIKMVKNEEDAMWAGFKKAFKDNFKQATLAWILVILAGVIIWAELYVSNIYEGQLMGTFYTILAMVEIFVLMMIMVYLFPLISRFENSLKNQIKNSFLLAISNLGSTLKLMVAWFAPIYASTVPAIFIYVWFLWLIFGIGLIAYGTSHTLRRVFNSIDERQAAMKEENEEKQFKAKDEPKKSRRGLQKGDITRRAALSNKTNMDK